MILFTYLNPIFAFGVNYLKKRNLHFRGLETPLKNWTSHYQEVCRTFVSHTKGYDKIIDMVYLKPLNQ